MTSTAIYKGHLRTEALHLQSGTIIETDAPVDNHGKGEKFSPTDLVATALGTCMLAVMGIAAKEEEQELVGTRCEIQKIMYAEPRRIGEIIVDLYFPEKIFTDKQKAIYERASKTCPVLESLHPDLIKKINFHWFS